MTIVTYKVQLKKYILKPLFHIVIPFTVLAISLATYFIRLCLIPMDATNRPPIVNICGEKYSNGIVYDTWKDDFTGTTTVCLNHIFEFRRKDFIKTIDDKKYFFVPETVKGMKITNASIYVYEGVDAIVVPKECLSFSILFFENPTSLIEIYAYNPSDVNFDLRIGNSSGYLDPESYKNINFYYEKDTNKNNWSFDYESYNENNIKVIQKEIEFYH